MSDYKQRMIREHRELQERISKLAHMLEGYAEGTLDFTPACSFQLLESQLYAMGTYANICRIQFVSATLVFGLAAFDCSLAISSSHTSLGVL